VAASGGGGVLWATAGATTRRNFFVSDYCVARAGREGKGMHPITKKKKIIHQVSHEHTKSRHVSPGAYVHPLTDEHMSRIFNGHQTFIGFGHRRL
jgi:hypothetical protein